MLLVGAETSADAALDASAVTGTTAPEDGVLDVETVSDVPITAPPCCRHSQNNTSEPTLHT